METAKRIVIGQCELYGLPISAPVKKDPIHLSNGVYISWRKRDDGSFALVIEELGRGFDLSGSVSIKQEVPFVE